MKRKLLGVFGFIMSGILLLPNNALAEDNADANVRTGGMSNYTVVATIPVEKNVTTIGDINQILTSDYNINFDKYVFVDMDFNEYNDSEVLCGSTISCQGPIDRPFVNLDLVEIDNTKKEVTINSIPPTDENMFYSIYQTNYETFGERISYKSCDSTYTKCIFTDHFNNKIYNNIVVNYNYDKDIASLAQTMIDNGLLNKTTFNLTDTELVNYINYGGTLADYSSEFKNQLSNLNFKFEMDARGGAFDPFGTHQIGFYKFLYNDTLYGVKSFMEVSGSHIIYVPTDTTDVKKAIENRLTEILGVNNYITVTESDETANAYLTRVGLDPIENGDSHYYTLVSSNEDSYTMGMEFAFIAVKDSSKINNEVAFKSNDLITNVSVETNSFIPLDTLIKVLELTSGEEYDNIMKVLGITDSEVFNISLYSNAQDKNITKLDNGKFLVSIPIPEKFEGKTLTVYYVDSDNNVTEHEVTIKDGFATFETDHFSTYTLAEKTSTTTNNPQTGDSIGLYIIVLGLSITSLLISGLYLNKRRFN